MAAYEPSGDRVDARTTKARTSLAVGAVALTVVVVVAVLLLVPAKSAAPAASCRWLDLVCRADAHQGVVAGLTLLIALVAGLIAYLTLNEESRGARRAEELTLQAKAHAAALEDREKEHYNELLREAFYEAVHNLRHLMAVLSWTASRRRWQRVRRVQRYWLAGSRLPLRDATPGSPGTRGCVHAVSGLPEAPPHF